MMEMLTALIAYLVLGFVGSRDIYMYLEIVRRRRQQKTTICDVAIAAATANRTLYIDDLIRSAVAAHVIMCRRCRSSSR